MLILQNIFRYITSTIIGNVPLILIFLSSCLFLILNGGHALDWPAISSTTGLLHFINPQSYAQDFFARAAAGESPRKPWLIFLSGLMSLNLSWWDTFYIVKLITCFLLPILFHQVIIQAISEIRKQFPLSTLTQTVVALFVTMPLWGPSLVNPFVIAWWPPLEVQALPQNVSILLLFTGWTFSYRSRIALLALAFPAALIHPPIFIFGTSFLFLISSDCRRNSRRAISLLCSSSLAFLMVYIFSKPAASLSAEDLSLYYAKIGHPFHYWFPEYGSFSPLPWWASLATVILLLVLFSFWAQRKLGGLFFWLIPVSIVGCFLIQFFFGQILPVRVILELGPTRFSSFGYWFLVFFVGLVFSFFPQGRFRLSETLDQRKGFIILFLIPGIIWFWISRDEFPVQARLYSKHPDLYDFAKKTASSAQFVIFQGMLADEFPLVTQRSIVFGSGFPFNESQYKEYAERSCLIYGCEEHLWNQPGDWIGEKQLNHYRSLAPKDFLKIRERYGADFAILDQDWSPSLPDFRPAFRNAGVIVYDLNALAHHFTTLEIGGPQQEQIE